MGKRTTGNVLSKVTVGVLVNKVKCEYVDLHAKNGRTCICSKRYILPTVCSLYLEGRFVDRVGAPSQMVLSQTGIRSVGRRRGQAF
jgi:hypothetical protein